MYIFIDIEFDNTYHGTLHGIISRIFSESNGVTHYILLNLSATFYTLDHNILINGLSSIGISWYFTRLVHLIPNW